MESVVISGGAGFVGSHLVDALLKRGYRVVVVDNLITGNPKNLTHLEENGTFVFLKQDCAQPIDVRYPVHYVLHFACPASPADYMRYPFETLFAGSYGTHRMLELAREHKARFLLASTSEVYGDPSVHPQPESYFGNVNTIGPRSVYDEAKRFAESLTMAYYRTHGLNTGIARIFNTYGPRMRLNDGRAIPNFVYQALTGRPITLFGNGSMTRSFCFISDLVEGLLRLLMTEIHEPVNIGNPDEFTILDLAKMVLEFTDSHSPLVYLPSLEDDPQLRKPDITRATKLLNWKPEVPLEKGLRITIEAFKREIEGYVAE